MSVPKLVAILSNQATCFVVVTDAVDAKKVFLTRTTHNVTITTATTTMVAVPSGLEKKFLSEEEASLVITGMLLFVSERKLSEIIINI